MRDEVTIIFKNKQYYNKTISEVVELFGDYDFPCFSKNDDLLLFSFTDLKVSISIKGIHLFIDIIFSKKETLSIPLKLDEIKEFYFDRLEGIAKYRYGGK